MGASRLAGLLLLLTATHVACQPSDLGVTSGEIVDLSHAFDGETIFWPTEVEGFVLEELAAGFTEQGYYYEANRFRSAEHGGTHIDAPSHFAEGRLSVDQIPLDRLVGNGIVVDVSARCAENPDYQIATADFEAWEASHGRIPDGAILLLYTGFGQRWGDRSRYLGTDEVGAAAVPKLHFPGLHPEAARWLVEERAIKAIGLDTASIDYGQSELFESHQILFARDIPAFENLMRLDELPAEDFVVVALPMKIRGGSGGPLRAIAILR
ncbi:MAG: cyclase family protein [Myxococcota bacterium]